METASVNNGLTTTCMAEHKQAATPVAGYEMDFSIIEHLSELFQSHSDLRQASHMLAK